MSIEFIIIVLTFLTAVPAVLGTTDSNGRLNHRGIIAIILAIVLGIGSYFKYLSDEKKEKEKDIQISELTKTLESTRGYAQSISISTSRIDTNVRKQIRPLYPAFTMNLGKQESKPIPVPLVKGMSVKIMNNNSDNSLFLCYNNKKRKHIQDTDDEIPILLEVDELGCYFTNESDLICTVNYVIWGSDELLAKSTYKKGINDEDNSPAKEEDDIKEINREENSNQANNNLSALTLVDQPIDNQVIEKFYVSIGCYGNK